MIEKPFNMHEEVEVHSLPEGDFNYLNGWRVVIIGKLEPRAMVVGDGLTVTSPCYRVRTPDGRNILVSPAGLKRPLPVRGDMDQKITWDECSWQPKEGWKNDY